MTISATILTAAVAEMIIAHRILKIATDKRQLRCKTMRQLILLTAIAIMVIAVNQ